MFAFLKGHLPVLLANGWASRGVCMVVDFLSAKRCASLAEYPVRTLWATGGVLKEQPLLCGGWNLSHDHQPLSACYIHDYTENIWRLHAHMTTGRYSHASVTMGDRVWITGGHDKHKTLKSTEYLYSNGSVFHGPDLPHGRQAHCMVDLLDGRVMILGGNTEKNGSGGQQSEMRNEVLIYDSINQLFTSAPSLMTGRPHHPACALFYSEKHDNRPVVMIVGGSSPGSYEFLDFTNPSAKWELSKSS